jgi:hypothetical protein
MAVSAQRVSKRPSQNVASQKAKTSAATEKGLNLVVQNLPVGMRFAAKKAMRSLAQSFRTVSVGHSTRFELVFTRKAKSAEVTILAPQPVAEEPGDGALARARSRGAETLAKIFDDPNMLSGEEFAELLGVTRMAVHNKRKNHQLLGIEGSKRGVRYPRWQLDQDGRPVTGLGDLLRKFGENRWAAYRFLIGYHAGLGEKTAIDALKTGRHAQVLEAAETVLSGDYS